MLGKIKCHICNNGELIYIQEFSNLPRVTSDCKPFSVGGKLAICSACGVVQKSADAVWKNEISQIYNKYDIYFQSNGMEQIVFNPSCPINYTRSMTLLLHVKDIIPFDRLGSLLDVGCGKGTFLQAMSNLFPGLKMYGHELTNINKSLIEKIKGVESTFSENISDIPMKFDIISLIHSLEHIESPIAFLHSLMQKLEPEGLLLIVVPNAETSPFDLVVADHASHFSSLDLVRLLAVAGLEPVVISTDWIIKEIVILAKVNLQNEEFSDVTTMNNIEYNYRWAVHNVNWIRSIIDQARLSATKAHMFGIFGTSIASMWLYGELGKDVDFFVDEDPARIGTLYGLPVFTPDNIPKHATIFIALIPEVALLVSRRIKRSDLFIEIPQPL